MPSAGGSVVTDLDFPYFQRLTNGTQCSMAQSNPLHFRASAYGLLNNEKILFAQSRNIKPACGRGVMGLRDDAVLYNTPIQ